MSAYVKTLKVSKEHIDDLQHINNVVYVQLVQDIATEHWSQLQEGMDTSEVVWVVLRHEVDYFGQAQLGDVIQIKTWVGETEGIKSVRYVEFLKDDKAIAKAKTTWCLLDAKSLRPKRITSAILTILEKGML